MEIPSGFSNKIFRMNPEEDDLLIDGDALREGMIVIVEENELRSDISDPTVMNTESGLENASKFNRWCQVTDIKRTANNQIVRFIGLYRDGTKRFFTASVGHSAWYVKKESILQLPKSKDSIKHLKPWRDASDDELIEVRITTIEGQVFVHHPKTRIEYVYMTPNYGLITNLIKDHEDVG